MLKASEVDWSKCMACRERKPRKGFRFCGKCIRAGACYARDFSVIGECAVCAAPYTMVRQLQATCSKKCQKFRNRAKYKFSDRGYQDYRIPIPEAEKQKMFLRMESAYADGLSREEMLDRFGDHYWAFIRKVSPALKAKRVGEVFFTIAKNSKNAKRQSAAAHE